MNTIPIVSIKDVSKIYVSSEHSVSALDAVSCTIYEGEILSLLGVNGAGKTTLSSILATVHPPTSGNIFFYNTSIYQDLFTYRMSLGFCPQKANLDAFLTVRDNLIFAGRYFLMPEEHIQERADFLLMQFDLVHYKNFNIDQLSGGTQQ